MTATLLLAGMLSLTPPALADCRAIDDAAARLACYDGYVDGLDTNSASTTLEAPISEAQRQAEFKEKAEAVRKGEAPAIVSNPVEIEADRDGKLTITLANGQVWEQLSSDRPYRVNSKKPPQQATITEAAFGSYRLRFDDSRQSLRVRRLK